MSLWVTVLLASAIAFGLKLAGHVVPHSWLDGARVARIAAMLPVALLAALVAVQTFTTTGGTFVVDARAGALAVAAGRARAAGAVPAGRGPGRRDGGRPARPRLGRLAGPGRRAGRRPAGAQEERAARQARTAARYSRCSAGRSLRWRCCSASSR